MVTHLLPEALGDDLDRKEGLLLVLELSAGSLSWSSHSGGTA
jgi:hypothetical protein